jgi:hypothetical protein
MIWGIGNHCGLSPYAAVERFSTFCAGALSLDGRMNFKSHLHTGHRVVTE